MSGKYNILKFGMCHETTYMLDHRIHASNGDECRSCLAQLPYTQESSVNNALSGLASSGDVAALRDTYHADLVQLIGTRHRT